MAITGSGAVSFSNLQTEFGGSNPISLSEYYRGGSYTTSNNTGVPTSGAISMSQFYSTTAADYVPAAVNWANLYVATDDSSGGAYVEEATQTITGINQTITLLIDTTNMGCTVSGPSPSGDVTVSAIKNGSMANSINISNMTSGASTSTAARSMTITAVSGDVIKFSIEVSVSDATGYATVQGSATWSVKNASSGNTVLDTFTSSASASTSGGA